LTSLLRSETRELIKKAVQSELVEFLSQYQDMTDNQGRPLVVRNGYLPEREIITGIGPVEIKVQMTQRPVIEADKGFISDQSCCLLISNEQRA
jgi:putative transposase